MRITIFVFLLSCFLFLPQVILADVIEESTPSAKVKVEKISTVIDRFKEKISLLFKFNSEDKIGYQQQLVEQRLGELDYIIATGQGDFIEEVSSRYASYVGRLSESLLSNKNSLKREQVLEMFKEHPKVLAKMRDNFPANSSFWMLLQHDINTIQIYTDKIQNFQ